MENNPPVRIYLGPLGPEVVQVPWFGLGPDYNMDLLLPGEFKTVEEAEWWIESMITSVHKGDGHLL
jgi:hypothetical protein